jgi:hypothetical protein
VGFYQTHKGYVSDKTTVNSQTAQRGRIYELRYKSETSSKTKYLVMGLNVYPKSGGKSKQLLHCLDLDEIPVAEVRKLIKTGTTIKTRVEEGLSHQRLEIDGRNTAYYDSELKKLQNRIPGVYKTFKLSKITRFELTDYDFLSIADTATKKKFGIVDEN